MDKNHIIIISICTGVVLLIIVGIILYWYNRYLDRYNYLSIDRENYREIIVNV